MKTFNIDMTLIIVFLTGLAYGTTYIYQRIFQAYYKLPTMFIDLNINTLTGTLFFIILGLTLILIVSSFLTNLILKNDSTFFEDIPLWVLLSLSLFAVFGAIVGGHEVAEKKENYMVVKQNKEFFAVVTTYKDNLVLAPLDIKKESIKPKFHTIEMKDAKNAEVIHFEDGIKVDKLKSSKELKKEIK
ncbi:hypothetical protein ACU5CE_33460 [Priestia megaterium]|uniref:hypothetical protein n=1 Tax=Priestia megaterium TaxID=1404 RepID=UPI00406BD65F